MGIQTTHDLERNSELQRRISSDLRQRIQTQSPSHHDDDDDYSADTKKTGRFSWFWIILIVLAILSLICIVFI